MYNDTHERRATVFIKELARCGGLAKVGRQAEYSWWNPDTDTHTHTHQYLSMLGPLWLTSDQWYCRALQQQQQRSTDHRRLRPSWSIRLAVQSTADRTTHRQPVGAIAHRPASDVTDSFTHQSRVIAHCHCSRYIVLPASHWSSPRDRKWRTAIWRTWKCLMFITFLSTPMLASLLSYEYKKAYS